VVGSLNYVIVVTKQIVINLVVEPNLIIDETEKSTVEDVTPTIRTYRKQEEDD
jgi:hypothetical protein